jgi:Flp pilus assembly protein TadG
MGRDRGAVTVELALALPVLCVLVWVALWAVGSAATQLACIDAARAGARAAARGESAQAVAELTRSVAPAGATITTVATVESVTVAVAARTRLRLLPGWPGIAVHGTAVARPEVIGRAALR